jgi:hypothetical protein
VIQSLYHFSIFIDFYSNYKLFEKAAFVLFHWAPKIGKNFEFAVCWQSIILLWAVVRSNSSVITGPISLPTNHLILNKQNGSILLWNLVCVAQNL